MILEDLKSTPTSGGTEEKMRRLFAELMHEHMARDERIHFLTADVGYKMLDRIRDDFPARFHNVGAAEQLMVGAGVGLALSGKIPVCYTITPFLLYRPFEWIRNYLSHDKIPVILVGSGRGKDYLHDGYTHWEDECSQTNAICPKDKEEMPWLLNSILTSGMPAYLNLRR